MANSDLKEQERLSFNDYNLEKHFIDYWDKLIDIWSKDEKYKDTIEIDAIWGREEYYKDGKDCFCVQIEKEQSFWFEDESLKKLLCPMHMPEPYWGNPNLCSIVIVDYNPLGGEDMNPHTYRGKNENDNYPHNSMIGFVKEKGYSVLVKDFPLLKKDGELKDDERWWLRSYEGRKWWRRKIEWMRHLIIDSTDTIEEGMWPAVDKKKKIYEWSEKVRYPFAIELCGWHSTGWPDNTFAIKGNLKTPIQNRFVMPLLQSINISTCKMAVCVGAQFRPSIFKEFFKEIEGIEFKDITSDLGFKKEEDYDYKEWMNKKEKIKCIVLSQKSIDNIPKVSDDTKKCIAVNIIITKTDKNNKPKEKSVIRYYRIYDVVEKGKNHIIFNTFAPGSNHHPADYFWPFEKELLRVIKEGQWKKKEDFSADF